MQYCGAFEYQFFLRRESNKYWMLRECVRSLVFFIRQANCIFSVLYYFVVSGLYDSHYLIKATS